MLRLCSLYTEKLFVRKRKAFRYSMNSKGTSLELVVHTHRTSCPSGCSRGLGVLNSSPISWLFTSVSVLFSAVLAPTDSLPVTVRTLVHTAPKCGTEPIPYVTPQFRDRRGAASLCYRNCAEITVLMCEQKPYQVWFSCRRKSCPVKLEHSLTSSCYIKSVKENTGKKLWNCKKS